MKLVQQSFRPDFIGIILNSFTDIDSIENAKDQPTHFTLSNLIFQMSERPCGNDWDKLISMGDGETWVIPASQRNRHENGHYFSHYFEVKARYGDAGEKWDSTYQVRIVPRNEFLEYDFQSSKYYFGTQSLIANFEKELVPVS